MMKPTIAWLRRFWMGWLLLGLAGVGLVAGLPAVLLVVAGLLFLVAILALWDSLSGLATATPLSLDEALDLAVVMRSEERKLVVLRALKDLQHERSLGKIGEEDYQRLTERYRGEALGLLTEIEKSLACRREEVEGLIKQRLARKDAGTTGSASGTSQADTGREP